MSGHHAGQVGCDAGAADQHLHPFAVGSIKISQDFVGGPVGRGDGNLAFNAEFGQGVAHLDDNRKVIGTAGQNADQRNVRS